MKKSYLRYIVRIREHCEEVKNGYMIERKNSYYIVSVRSGSTTRSRRCDNKKEIKKFLKECEVI